MKKNIKVIWITALVIFTVLLLATIILIAALNVDMSVKLPLVILLSLLSPTILFFIVWNYKWNKQRSFNVKKSINFYFENIVSNSGMGIVGSYQYPILQ
jgi:cytochrome bd-type quinol oxidase subunit 2